MNSYGAGYDAGYLAAIIHAREQCGPMYGALTGTPSRAHALLFPRQGVSRWHRISIRQDLGQ
jgi:hypothetical protein